MSTETIRRCDCCGETAKGRTGMLPPGWAHINAMRGNDFYDGDYCDHCIEEDATLRMILSDDLMLQPPEEE